MYQAPAQEIVHEINKALEYLKQAYDLSIGRPGNSDIRDRLVLAKARLNQAKIGLGGSI